MKPKFRTQFDLGERTGDIENNEPSLTNQADKDSCDINVIMNRFLRTGELVAKIRENPMYGDFTDVVTYQESLDLVRFAEEQFEGLPSHLRDRFGNSPQKFLEFTNDPENAEEMAKLGLMATEAVERVKTKKEAKEAAAAAAAAAKKDSPPA